MARFLVDANVLSEPTKSAPVSRVVDWLVRNERFVAIDPVMLGEIRYRILLLAEGLAALALLWRGRYGVG